MSIEIRYRLRPTATDINEEKKKILKQLLEGKNNFSNAQEKLNACNLEKGVIYPSEWEKGNFDDVDKKIQILTVEENSSEYNKIKEEFEKGEEKIKKITSIQRVQNPELWAKYFNYARYLAENINKTKLISIENIFQLINEKMTKYYSSKPSINDITNKGIDVRTNKGIFGSGIHTFFDSNCLRNNPDKIILCRTVAGKIFKQTNETKFIMPPDNNNSIIGVMGNCQNLVTFDHDSVYPAYIITIDNKTV